MNFEEFARKYLLSNGMNEGQAGEIIAMAKHDEFLSLLNWQEEARSEDAFISAINTVATDYIEENMPQAWFRHRFAGV